MFGRLRTRRKRKRLEARGIDTSGMGATTIDFLTDFWTIFAITEILEDLDL